MFHCCNLKKLIRIMVLDIILIAVAASITVFAKEAEPQAERVFLPIIMYHSITENATFYDDYKVSPETIENDLKYLSNNHYSSVFVEDLINYVYYDKPLPENPVMITLDDGFYNNISHLLPLLEKYDMKATISIVGQYTEILAEKDSHVSSYSYLTWEDIKNACSSGRIEFGNHTYNMHSNNVRKGCSKLSYETNEEYAEILTQDVGLCQNLMQINIGTTPVVFAYPYGYISEESIPILKDMGFLATLTCFEKPNYITHDPDCLFGLNRYNRPQNVSTESFMKKILSE